MSTLEELELRVINLEKENRELNEENKRIPLLEEENITLKKELSEFKERVKFLEKALEKIRKELRKYHNENTPSGSIPPYLKPTIK